MANRSVIGSLHHKDHPKKPYTSPARSSNVSPFLGAANAPLILLTAILEDLEVGVWTTITTSHCPPQHECWPMEVGGAGMNILVLSSCSHVSHLGHRDVRSSIFEVCKDPAPQMLLLLVYTSEIRC